VYADFNAVICKIAGNKLLKKTGALQQTAYKKLLIWAISHYPIYTKRSMATGQ